LRTGWTFFRRAPFLSAPTLLAAILGCVGISLVANRALVADPAVGGLSPQPDNLTARDDDLVVDEATGDDAGGVRFDATSTNAAEATDGPKPRPGMQLAEKREDDEETGEADTGAKVDKDADPLADLLRDWDSPQFVFFVTGRQHGYMEPCGCTGLENAKGGLSRRYTMLKRVRKRGWNVIPIDVGNQVRRFGKQADMKFQRTADLLKKMNYAAVAFGPDDLRLSINGLLFPVNDAQNFVVSNVDLAQLNRSVRVIVPDKTQTRVGITGVLGVAEQKKINRSETDVVVTHPRVGIEKAKAEFQRKQTKFNVLLAHASLEETDKIVRSYPNDFDLVVTAGGAGEPTLEPATIKGSKSRIVQVGTKGMYVGLVGVFDNPQRPLRYVRVALDAQFEDSDEVLEIFGDYQSDLEVQGLEGLGVKPIKHPSGNRFVGYQTCGECHTTAAEIFEKTPHHHATTSLIKPPNSRGEIPRHFDPECLSCHVTGWEPQKYLPFESGYLNVAMEAVHANGCENCHGPGSAHVAAENGDADVSDEEIDRLRSQMRLTLEEARKTKGYECHDIDNSPEFKFDEYWERVKHYGKD